MHWPAIDSAYFVHYMGLGIAVIFSIWCGAGGRRWWSTAPSTSLHGIRRCNSCEPVAWCWRQELVEYRVKCSLRVY